MKLLNKLLRSESESEIKIGSVMAGTCIELSKVPDEAFSQGMLGLGVAVIPSDGKVYAPVDGEMAVVFATGHALAVKSVDGAEILIHIGLDTVTLAGKPFTVHVVQGEKVKKGDILVEVDLEQIKKMGLNPITPILVSNPQAFSSVIGITGKEVLPGDTIIRIKNDKKEWKVADQLGKK